jgi:hypothetical protein
MRRLDVAQPLRRRLAVRDVARERDRRVERIAVDQRVEERRQLRSRRPSRPTRSC